jgi:hypothetical protein
MYLYTLQKIYACLKNFIVFFFHILFCTIQVMDKRTIFTSSHIYIYIIHITKNTTNVYACLKNFNGFFAFCYCIQPKKWIKGKYLFLSYSYLLCWYTLHQVNVILIEGNVYG